MTIDLFVDNDVLIKCSCYRLLAHVQSPKGEGSVGVLGAARFVVGKYLARRGNIVDRAAAQKAFGQYLESATELEPTESELATATAIEEEAQRLGLDLDGGESQLCAMALHRGMALLLTGDKRAIIALERICSVSGILGALGGRIACMEQAISGVTDRIGPIVARDAICAEPHVDKAISICFECSQSTARQNFHPVGLASYIEDLRGKAPKMLYPSDSL